MKYGAAKSRPFPPRRRSRKSGKPSPDKGRVPSGSPGGIPRRRPEYYETKQTGLGERFTSAVEAAVAHVAAAPESWRIIEEDIRRCLTKVFPYAVLYSIEPGYVLIVAVMHCRREPGYWRNRN